MHVLIDTSIYRRDPARRSAAFCTLFRLASGGLIHLHVPMVVQREFETYIEDKCKDEAGQISATAKNLKRSLAESLHGLLEETLGASRTLAADLPAAAVAEFGEWLANANAAIHDVAPGAAATVLDGYFTGRAPFETRKARQDFPDAFIWESARAIAKEQGHLSVVTADGGLGNAAATDDRVTVYGSLDNFIESDDCQELLRAHFTSVNMARFRTVLPGVEERLQHRASTAIERALESSMVTSPQIPEDNSEARVASVGKATDFSIDADEARDYGEGVIVVPFTASSESLLNYCIFISDYFALDEKRSKHISVSEWNDHYYDAEEAYELEVEGRLTLILDVDRLQEKELDEAELADLAANAKVKVDAIESISVTGD